MNPRKLTQACFLKDTSSILGYQFGQRLDLTIWKVFSNLNDSKIQFCDCVLCCLERKMCVCASHGFKSPSGQVVPCSATKVTSKKYKMHCKPEIKHSTAWMREKKRDIRVSHVSVSNIISYHFIPMPIQNKKWSKLIVHGFPGKLSSFSIFYVI